jgi:hypothetical protein
MAERSDGVGGLHRLGLNPAGRGSDTGELICALPDAVP